MNLGYSWYGQELSGPNNPYRQSLVRSINRWNSSLIPFYFSENSSGQIILTTYSLNDGYGGITEGSCSTTSPSYRVQARVRINTFQGTYSYSQNQIDANSAHELGHSMSIGHIATTTEPTILEYNPNTNLYYSPQRIDIALINQVYP